MIKILILEDQKEGREALEKILAGYHQAKVSCTATKEEALQIIKAAHEPFDLFLLDINLNTEEPEEIGGYEVAEEIRKDRRYEFTPIVMVTSVANMEMTAYRRLHCYAFLVKPYLKEEISELVEKILSHQKEQETPAIIVKKDGINYKIKCQDIVYIKAVPRGICLSLKREEMTVLYLSIRQIAEKLPANFIQIHRMYMINRQYLEQVDLVNRLIKMQGKEEALEIGVTYKEKVRKSLNE